MARSRDIETERLIIQPFSETHITGRYVAWLNDPDIVRFSEQRHVNHTIESCRDYLQSFENSLDYFWAILSRRSHEGHIGNINAYIDIHNMIADIGILIGEKALWGKGYGLEAFIAVRDFLFQDLSIRKVTAGTVTVNEGMLKIIKRAGMKEDGRRSRHYLFDGHEVDVIHFAIFNDEWLKEKTTWN